MTEAKPKPVPHTIFHLLASAKDNIGAVAKKEKNNAQNFNFRGIDAVVNAVAPAFNELGIINVPKVIEHDYDVVTTARGTQMGHVTVIVEYTFYGPEGDSVAAVVLGEAFDAGDKAGAKAMSVAYRTALLQVLNLPTDEVDPDATSYERAAPSANGAKSTQDWAKRVQDAATVDDLRKLWKDAGRDGALKSDVVTPTGEKLTLEVLLHRRNDELSFQAGNS